MIFHPGMRSNVSFQHTSKVCPVIAYAGIHLENETMKTLETLQSLIQEINPDIASRVEPFKSIQQAEDVGAITKKEGRTIAIALMVYRRAQLLGYVVTQ